MQAPLENTHFFKEYRSESAIFAAFLLGLLSLIRGPAFRPKACLPARLEAHRDHSGGLRKGFCSSFSYLVIFNKALSTNTHYTACVCQTGTAETKLGEIASLHL